MPCPTNCLCDEGGTILHWGKGFYPVFSAVSLLVREYLIFVFPPFQASGQFQLSHAVNLQYSHCNPDDNCTLKYGQNSASQILCRLCADGTEGRLCSKCRCTETCSCKFWSHDRCVSGESRVTVGILESVGAMVTIFLVVVLYISWRLPKEAPTNRISYRRYRTLKVT